MIIVDVAADTSNGKTQLTNFFSWCLRENRFSYCQLSLLEVQPVYSITIYYIYLPDKKNAALKTKTEISTVCCGLLNPQVENTIGVVAQKCALAKCAPLGVGLGVNLRHLNRSRFASCSGLTINRFFKAQCQMKLTSYSNCRLIRFHPSLHPCGLLVLT